MTKPSIGRRIAVFGPSGSGKSTLGRRLGELLDLHVVELDSINHMPGWQERPVEEFRSILEAQLDEHQDTGWVCDGNYGTRVRDIVLAHADTVVRLQLPFRIVYPRLVARTLRRMWTGEELWNGNRESFGLTFLSRDSILLWGLTHWKAHYRGVERDLARFEHSAETHILRSPAEVEEFLTSAKANASHRATS